MNSDASKSVDKRRKQKNEDDVKFRLAAEFLAGPGGYLEKAEVFSKWFKTLDEAKEHVQKNSEQEVNEYPYSNINCRRQHRQSYRIIKCEIRTWTIHIVSYGRLDGVQHIASSFSTLLIFQQLISFCGRWFVVVVFFVFFHTAVCEMYRIAYTSAH